MGLIIHFYFQCTQNALGLLLFWINYQPGVVYKSIAYKKTCSVFFFLPSKDDVKCVYLIFQWDNIVQGCIRMYCYKDVYMSTVFFLVHHS